jgi:hypothetical protein
VSASNLYEIRPGASTGKIGTIKDAATTVAFEPEEPVMVSSVSAILPLLPDPLTLRYGPLLVTVESWSDGSVVARLPCAALYGSGESDAAALDDLGSVIYDFVGSLRGLLARGESIGGPLKKDWENVSALVDMSRLTA